VVPDAQTPTFTGAEKGWEHQGTIDGVQEWVNGQYGQVVLLSARRGADIPEAGEAKACKDALIGSMTDFIATQGTMKGKVKAKPTGEGCQAEGSFAVSFDGEELELSLFGELRRCSQSLWLHGLNFSPAGLEPSQPQAFWGCPE
jgi:hypothetical protein